MDPALVTNTFRQIEGLVSDLQDHSKGLYSDAADDALVHLDRALFFLRAAHRAIADAQGEE